MTNPYDRADPLRRDAWDAGYAAGVAQEREHADRLADVLRAAYPFAACIEGCATHKDGPDTCTTDCGCEIVVRDAKDLLAAHDALRGARP